MGLLPLIGFDQWVIHVSINQEGRTCEKSLCVLDGLFPDGPPVEVRDLEGIIIAFAGNLCFSVGTGSSH